MWSCCRVFIRLCTAYSISLLPRTNPAISDGMQWPPDRAVSNTPCMRHEQITDRVGILEETIKNEFDDCCYQISQRESIDKKFRDSSTQNLHLLKKPRFAGKIELGFQRSWLWWCLRRISIEMISVIRLIQPRFQWLIGTGTSFAFFAKEKGVSRLLSSELCWGHIRTNVTDLASCGVVQVSHVRSQMFSFERVPRNDHSITIHTAGPHCSPYCGCWRSDEVRTSGPINRNVDMIMVSSFRSSLVVRLS